MSNQSELLVPVSALKELRGLFSEIRNDWSDPRFECREGWRIIDGLLAASAPAGDGGVGRRGFVTHDVSDGRCLVCGADEIELALSCARPPAPAVEVREALEDFCTEMDRSSGRPSFRCYQRARATLSASPREMFQEETPLTKQELPGADRSESETVSEDVQRMKASISAEKVENSRPVARECFWKACSNRARCMEFGSCVAIYQSQHKDEIFGIKPGPSEPSPSSRSETAGESAVREAFEDMRTHRKVWRRALEGMRDQPATDDFDDRGYWEHELKAFDRTFDALGSGASHD